MSNEIASVVSLACVDLYVAADVEFVVIGVDSIVANVEEGLLVKHKWLIFRLILLNFMKWKPLVKMKLVADLSLGIKV